MQHPTVDLADPHAGTVRGRDFRLLWAAFASSNLADGVLLSAGPLLVTTLTRDPTLVALAVAVQRLPTFVLSLPVGALVDRADRRRLARLAHLSRAVVLAALAVAVQTGNLSLGLLYAALLALGSAEVVGDTAGQTLVVATVTGPEVGPATSRLVGSRIVANQLVGPPLGALLLGVGLASPFGLNALLVLAAGILVGRMSRDGREQRGDAGATVGRRSRGVAAVLRADVAEGWRFAVATPAVRRLVVLIAAFNITFGLVVGIQVLWALERLGLDEVGYGLLLTAGAVGGLAGSALFPRLERRFSYATLLRVGLLVETGSHVLFGLTTSPVVAGAGLLLFGVHEAVWGSLSGTIRVHVVPEHLLGRVNSINRLAVFGPLVLGMLLGGLLADAQGIVTTYLTAGAGAAVTTCWAWPRMRDLGAAADHAVEQV